MTLFGTPLILHITLLLISLVGSTLIELAVQPATQRVKRPIRAWCIHILIVSALFTFIVLTLARPYLAALLTLAMMLLFTIVSNAKFKTLREPLVFSDLAMFSQAFKHPRLYFPFLGLAGIAAIIIGALVLITLVLIEPMQSYGLPAYLLITATFITCTILAIKLSKHISFQESPTEDLAQFGLITPLLGYYIQSRSHTFQERFQQSLYQSPFAFPDAISEQPNGSQHGQDSEKQGKQSSHNKPLAQKTKDNIIVIQSESFFDPRHLHSDIAPDILNHYDYLRSNAHQHGRLDVPAWGANTLRTEFAFLSGLDSQQLGFYRYYPYQFLHRYDTPTLASYLKQQGYYCICIHPYHQTFFNRDKVYPAFGFDEFIGIEAFQGNNDHPNQGAYVSDAAVTRLIIEQLEFEQRTDKPLFIFVITMENHGPLHLELLQEHEADNYYTSQPPQDHHDLTVYLRHIRNADAMIGTMHQYLSEHPQPTTLCFYGDHIPSLPKTYDATGYDDKRTDYIIWRNQACAKTQPNTPSSNTPMTAVQSSASNDLLPDTSAPIPLSAEQLAWALLKLKDGY